MAADGFFEILKRKITREPDRRFDQVFWRKFEREFGVSPDSPKPGFIDQVLFWIRPFRHFVGFAGAGALAIALYVKAPWRQLAVQPNDQVGIELAQYQGVLENLELFETLDDVELSDQDWKVLLGEENLG